MAIWQDKPELVDKLTELWDEGKSCSQIARALGNGISRNAVIGRVTRMGLSTRANPFMSPVVRTHNKKAAKGFVLPSAGASRSKIKIEPAKPEFAAGSLVPAFVLPDGKFVTVLTVSDAHCRYTYGDPGQVDFHYCAHPKVKGCFCKDHAPFCFQPPQAQVARRRQDASQ